MCFPEERLGEWRAQRLKVDVFAFVNDAPEKKRTDPLLKGAKGRFFIWFTCLRCSSPPPFQKKHFLFFSGDRTVFLPFFDQWNFFWLVGRVSTVCHSDCPLLDPLFLRRIPFIMISNVGTDIISKDVCRTKGRRRTTRGRRHRCSYNKESALKKKEGHGAAPLQSGGGTSVVRSSLSFIRDHIPFIRTLWKIHSKCSH